MNKGPMLLQQVIKTIQQYKMISSGDHVVIGVSGGADSVALLYVLHSLKGRWKLMLTVAHLDHMLRGEESQQEAAFVKSLADGLEVPCVIEARDVRAFKNEKALSLQEAARDVRYGFFQDGAAFGTISLVPDGKRAGIVEVLFHRIWIL